MSSRERADSFAKVWMCKWDIPFNAKNRPPVLVVIFIQSFPVYLFLSSYHATVKAGISTYFGIHLLTTILIGYKFNSGIFLGFLG
jgi:hypothetical protein